ncbi:unnamed protein product [Thlaspi arvense]|uniref:ceramide glucosyltransferase n=1 Tax=Thlaspi arvense TaxID=13288 RepID=A0AAU9RSV6_THLAR|nr:unnamed protein product [Thlaspi arvense]
MKDSMRAGNSFAFLSHDINYLEHSNQVNLPRVTVVMPLKGFGEHNLHNWRSQDCVDAKIVVAGLSTTCSQKIHNQLVGLQNMHKDSKYVLFLDDDVRLHPGSIGSLTAEMEKNPEIFIQTGYPLDLPSGSLGSYCIYEYHMPCSMGFATGGKNILFVGRVHDGKYLLPLFLTAACLMMHADDFRTDRHGVVSELQDGGYSDDMTLAAIAGAHKRLITSPPVAVFPHPLASDLSFSRYWNYLRKQTFVLESYTTKVNWIMNRALFSTHCYLSWGFVAPYFMAVVHVAAALRIHSKGYLLGDTAFTSCVATAKALLLRLLFCLYFFMGCYIVGCLAICTFVELLSMWNLTRIEVQLCNMLSPEATPLSLASYNWCLVSALYLLQYWWIIFYPVSAMRSHFSQSINWSGIRYHLKDGKISKIDRSKDKGPKFTDLEESIYMGRKELLQEPLYLVICQGVWPSGGNPRNMTCRNEVSNKRNLVIVVLVWSDG